MSIAGWSDKGTWSGISTALDAISLSKLAQPDKPALMARRKRRGFIVKALIKCGRAPLQAIRE